MQFFGLFLWPLTLTFDLWPLLIRGNISLLISNLPSKFNASRHPIGRRHNKKNIYFYNIRTFVTFDLWPLTPIYQYIFVLSYSTLTTSYKLICLIVCKIIYQNCLFSQNDLCDLWPLTPWPQNPTKVLSPQDIPSYQVWCQTISQFLRYWQKQNGTDGRTDDLKT